MNELNIPLFITTHKPRRTLPEKVISLLEEWHVKGLYANIEYEVDELRRDIRVCELGHKRGIGCSFVHDKLIVEPGILKTKEGRAYAVRVSQVMTLPYNVYDKVYCLSLSRHVGQFLLTSLYM